MCEKHSRKKAVKLGMLFNSVDGIDGEVGITDVYRGGMEIFRYGLDTKMPDHAKIAEFAIFVIGKKADQDLVKVKLLDAQANQQHYQVGWPKEWELTFASVGMLARSPNEVPLFDYVSEFLKLL